MPERSKEIKTINLLEFTVRRLETPTNKIARHQNKSANWKKLLPEIYIKAHAIESKNIF